MVGIWICCLGTQQPAKISTMIAYLREVTYMPRNILVASKRPVLEPVPTEVLPPYTSLAYSLGLIVAGL